jgi:hypothetical protein
MSGLELNRQLGTYQKIEIKFRLRSC